MPPKKKTKAVIDPNLVKKLFNDLSKGKPEMSDDDLFQFFTQHLKIDPADPIFGYLATTVMGIQKIQVTTYENFFKLFEYTSTPSLKQLNDIINKDLRKEMEKPEQYKAMYKKLFNLYTGKHKTLDFDVAEQLWTVYLGKPLKFVYYKEFFVFLDKLQVKSPIYNDQWNMIYEFACEIKDVKNGYKSEDGWPLFIDKFVDFLNGQ